MEVKVATSVTLGVGGIFANLARDHIAEKLADGGILYEKLRNLIITSGGAIMHKLKNNERWELKKAQGDLKMALDQFKMKKFDKSKELFESVLKNAENAVYQVEEPELKVQAVIVASYCYVFLRETEDAKEMCFTYLEKLIKNEGIQALFDEACGTGSVFDTPLKIPFQKERVRFIRNLFVHAWNLQHVFTNVHEPVTPPFAMSKSGNLVHPLTLKPKDNRIKPGVFDTGQSQVHDTLQEVLGLPMAQPIDKNKGYIYYKDGDKSQKSLIDIDGNQGYVIEYHLDYMMFVEQIIILQPSRNNDGKRYLIDFRDKPKGERPFAGLFTPSIPTAVRAGLFCCGCAQELILIDISHECLLWRIMVKDSATIKMIKAVEWNCDEYISVAVTIDDNPSKYMVSLFPICP